MQDNANINTSREPALAIHFNNDSPTTPNVDTAAAIEALVAFGSGSCQKFYILEQALVKLAGAYSATDVSHNQLHLWNRTPLIATDGFRAIERRQFEECRNRK